MRATNGWLGENLERVRRVRVVGLTARHDGQTVRIGVTEKARDTLRRMQSSWTLDLPLAFLTDWPTMADGCLVWQPGATGVNAITPGKGKGEVLGPCFGEHGARVEHVTDRA